jgi:hypothetical protein
MSRKFYTKKYTYISCTSYTILTNNYVRNIIFIWTWGSIVFCYPIHVFNKTFELDCLGSLTHLNSEAKTQHWSLVHLYICPLHPIFFRNNSYAQKVRKFTSTANTGTDARKYQQNAVLLRLRNSGR